MEGSKSPDRYLLKQSLVRHLSLSQARSEGGAEKSILFEGTNWDTGDAPRCSLTIMDNCGIFFYTV